MYNHLTYTKTSITIQNTRYLVQKIQIQIFKEEMCMVRRNTMVYADEVAATLGVAKETAYKIIKSLNKDLEEKGYVIVSGRLPRRFWEEKFYGGADALYGDDETSLAGEGAVVCL